MNDEMIQKIQNLNEVTDELSKARAMADKAKAKVAHLTALEADLRREIREDPEARALFGLRAPGKRTKREG